MTRSLINAEGFLGHRYRQVSNESAHRAVLECHVPPVEGVDKR